MSRTTRTAFNSAPPVRLYEVGGDIHAPLRKLRDKYLAKLKEGDVFAGEAARAITSLIPNRYQEFLTVDEARDSEALPGLSETIHDEVNA